MQGTRKELRSRTTTSRINPVVADAADVDKSMRMN